MTLPPRPARRERPEPPTLLTPPVRAWAALAISLLAGCASTDGGFGPALPPPQVTTVPSRATEAKVDAPGMQLGEHAHAHPQPTDGIPAPQDMRLMGGLLKRAPITGWTFLVGGLALAGF
ncbi:MAG TPA: hypothetical protein PLU79_23175, partial [Burkholderiaceae bacterium]|nr:hypothetical protein [Burkholderiaceae bacterium]